MRYKIAVLTGRGPSGRIFDFCDADEYNTDKDFYFFYRSGVLIAQYERKHVVSVAVDEHPPAPSPDAKV
jgi:hypothetical protein